MREACFNPCVGDAARSESGRASSRSAAEWLGLAATPTFAAMALLTGVFSSSQPDILCAATDHASPLTGMTAMYLLMSAIHAAPWLKLIAGRGAVSSSR